MTFRLSNNTVRKCCKQKIKTLLRKRGFDSCLSIILLHKDCTNSKIVQIQRITTNEVSPVTYATKALTQESRSLGIFKPQHTFTSHHFCWIQWSSAKHIIRCLAIKTLASRTSQFIPCEHQRYYSSQQVESSAFLSCWCFINCDLEIQFVNPYIVIRQKLHQLAFLTIRSIAMFWLLDIEQASKQASKLNGFVSPTPPEYSFKLQLVYTFCFIKR